MKKLIVACLMLVSCSGGGESPAEPECTNLCIDSCNKMYVCGMVTDCEAERVGRCEEQTKTDKLTTTECYNGRVEVIKFSCEQAWYYF